MHKMQPLQSTSFSGSSNNIQNTPVINTTKTTTTTTTITPTLPISFNELMARGLEDDALKKWLEAKKFTIYQVCDSNLNQETTPNQPIRPQLSIYQQLLHTAARVGKYRRCLAILEIMTCNINSANKSGNTPLHLAYEGRWFKIVCLLIVYGADRDAKNDCQKTPKMMAGSKKIKEEVQKRIDNAIENAKIRATSNQYKFHIDAFENERESSSSSEY